MVLACVLYKFSICFVLRWLCHVLLLVFFLLIPHVVLCSCGRFGILRVSKFACVSTTRSFLSVSTLAIRSLHLVIVSVTYQRNLTYTLCMIFWLIKFSKTCLPTTVIHFLDLCYVDSASHCLQRIRRGFG